MDIRPIKSKRTTEIILEQIKGLIVKGELCAGDRLLTENELAERFEVSRTSVREALAALSLTGILEIRQGGGIFVKANASNAIIEPLTFILLLEKDKLQNILEVRKALEVEAAGLAAQRRKEEDLAILKELIEQMEADLPEAKNSEALDLKFHLTLAKATDNPLLDRMMNTVQEIMGQTLQVTRALWMSATAGTTARLLEDHRSIYETIRDQNADLARRLTYEHLRKVEMEFSKYKDEDEE
ncbi:transcriptional regulator [Desulfitobacterium dichloroeliminans LMG P-21439]|uniref:Transcriptional regulator n=1 Tax=Desulfitobacterium dichloroeliminans (strain LMG P-21439 / DCA1) TaxID=871963 RepID=L0FCH7_DESDL|nr:FadR/GntR family transcriptional regulator [Desulfitobacterium dichloroeliminans]AGA70643.1 transcriptional regulator [Desulfitobacterium dichloroeliminans LMG P-21439]